jgi:hypothetical protein
MITLKDYLNYNRIPSGLTTLEHQSEFAKLFNLDINKLTDKQIDKKIKEFVSILTISRKEHKKIKLGKKWYVVDRDLDGLKHSQWVYFDGVMKGLYDNYNDEESKENNLKMINEFINENSNKIIASFLRPCRIYKFFPKIFDINKANDVAEKVLDLDIRIILELTGFFFHYTTNFMMNGVIEYSEKLEKEIWDQVKEEKK